MCLANQDCGRNTPQGITDGARERAAAISGRRVAATDCKSETETHVPTSAAEGCKSYELTLGLCYCC
jgi:hypothetical protein